MITSLTYIFHVSSAASSWHGHQGVQNMRRRKSTRPQSKRRFSGKKTFSIFCKLNIARRPATVVLSFGFAAAIISYIMLRSKELRTSKSRSKYRTRRDDDRELERAPVPRAPVVKANVTEEFDHDPDAFTQGLVFHDGFFYESTGLFGKSSLRKVEVSTGRVVAAHKLTEKDFGEGLALTGENLSKVVQVLWKVGKAYVYDRVSLREISSFSFEGDAWGLASHPNDSGKIFLSDGTSTIKLLQLESNRFRILREIIIHDGAREVGLLNELEVVGNELWANVWMSDFVARIDIETGLVKSWVDLRGILHQSAISNGHTPDVLNGIAYDAFRGAIYVTGKHWPKLYRISVTEQMVADDVAAVTNAFFLNPDQVAYVHQYIIA